MTSFYLLNYFVEDQLGLIRNPEFADYFLFQAFSAECCKNVNFL